MVDFLAGMALLTGVFILYSRRAEAQPARLGGGGGALQPNSWHSRLNVADVRALVDRINAETYGGWFDPALVMAVIQTESSFRATAYRFESHLNDASYGLMQVLFRTARDRGYDGPAEGLYDPETNIRVGMAHLKWGHDFLASRLGRAPEFDLWVGAYNAGVGNALRGFTPAGYVNKVRRAMASYA